MNTEKITLVLTFDQLRIVDQAIQQLPFYVAAPIIDAIGQQVREQQNQKARDA